MLHPGEAETFSSVKVSPTRSENQTVEGKGKAAAKTGEQSREDSGGEARKLNDDGDVTGEGSKISLIMGGLPDRAGPGPQELIAELLDVSCGASDLLGKETSITLTIRCHAEWVVARSGTVKLEPPSTCNDWTGIYDELGIRFGSRGSRRTMQMSAPNHLLYKSAVLGITPKTTPRLLL